MPHYHLELLNYAKPHTKTTQFLNLLIRPTRTRNAAVSIYLVTN